MEYLFDTANLAELERCAAAFPFTGVTGNPTILKAEGDVPFFEQIRAIRRIIGPERSLHVQVVASTAEMICAEAHRLLREIDDRIYIKILTDEEGLRAMRMLKAEGVRITATGIYYRTQGFLAIAAGADYIAPYCNRMANQDIDFRATISSFRRMIEEDGAATRIVAASFHNIGQVNDALLAGAHCVTVPPALLHTALASPAIHAAAEGFAADWHAIHGNCGICDL